MQHDYFQKKNCFDLNDPTPGVVGVLMVKIFATMLLHASFLQHGHILKKVEFWPLPEPSSPPRGPDPGLELKSSLICFISIVLLSVCKISVKNIDN